jgi:excisionase family DNA binding protein
MRQPAAIEDAPEALTVKQAAERLYLSVASIYRLVRTGEIASRRVGPNQGKIMLDAASVSGYWERSFQLNKKVEVGPYRFIKLD